MSRLPWGKLGLFAGGVLFGTAGIKILGSQDAKKCYTNATAAVLRAKDSVMETVTTVRENCDDILSDAKEINAERIAADTEAVIADAAEAADGSAETAAPVPREDRRRNWPSPARKRVFAATQPYCQPDLRLQPRNL